MGREAVRLLFRGRGPKDPQVTEGEGGGSRYPGAEESAPTWSRICIWHFGALLLVLHWLLASISYTLISPHSFWKLECRPRTLAGPGPAGGLLANRAHLGLRQERPAEEGEQAPAVEEGRGSAARGTRDARSAIDTAQTKDTRKTLS